jgi:hypothetical protein
MREIAGKKTAYNEGHQLLFILFEISDAKLAWDHHLLSVGCEFAHQNKIGHFTCMTETERQGVDFINIQCTAFTLIDP